MNKIKTLTTIDLSEHGTKNLSANLREIVAYQQKVLLQTNELAQNLNDIITMINDGDSGINAVVKFESAIAENTKSIELMSSEINGVNELCNEVKKNNTETASALISIREAIVDKIDALKNYVDNKPDNTEMLTSKINELKGYVDSKQDDNTESINAKLTELQRNIDNKQFDSSPIDTEIDRLKSDIRTMAENADIATQSDKREIAALRLLIIELTKRISAIESRPSFDGAALRAKIAADANDEGEE